MRHLKLAAIETHVADARTCCLQPGQHHPPPDERTQQLEAAGVRPDLVRLSCGLENKEDLIADICARRWTQSERRMLPGGPGCLAAA